MQSVEVILKYERLSEDSKIPFLDNHMHELVCEGCGMPIAGPFTLVPKNLNALGRTVVLHFFPIFNKGGQRRCKLRFCNGCGANVNTITRTCKNKFFGHPCDTVLSPNEKECPKCFSREDIEITSTCTCGLPNKQDLVQEL